MNAYQIADQIWMIQNRVENGTLRSCDGARMMRSMQDLARIHDVDEELNEILNGSAQRSRCSRNREYCEPSQVVESVCHTPIQSQTKEKSLQELVNILNSYS